MKSYIMRNHDVAVRMKNKTYQLELMGVARIMSRLLVCHKESCTNFSSVLV